MNLTIHQVITGVYKALIPLNIITYKLIKPETQTKECIAINYMPLSKNNAESWNDVIIYLYEPKLSGEANTARIESICNQIRTFVNAYVSATGIICFNENKEPETSNMDTNYTVSQIVLTTKNS